MAMEEEGDRRSEAYAWYVAALLTLIQAVAFVDRQVLAHFPSHAAARFII